MEQRIAEYKKLQREAGIWREQKYQDGVAMQNAAMSGRRHDASVTARIESKLQEAQDAIAIFEFWDWEAVEESNRRDAAAKAEKTNAALKSVLNS